MLQPFKSRWVKKALTRWPGERVFGMYRFLPIFFLLGAALEFSMINWHVGQTNFYRTYKRRQATELALQQLQEQKDACAAFLSMVAGAQLVHLYYRPLDDMTNLVETEKRRLQEEAGELSRPSSSPTGGPE